jgi:hypothetical protein
VLPRFIAQPHFADGKSGWLELANGYICLQDKQGTFWWTRFAYPGDLNLDEVRGELQFNSGYVIHRSDGKDIWLRMVEDKILVRRLQGLTGQSVIAKGQLRKIPRNVNTSIPTGAAYLDNGFTIEAAH